METSGIIIHGTNLLKPELLLFQLTIRCNMIIYTFPCVQHPTRKILLPHRSGQSAAVHPQQFCRRFGLPYILVGSEAEISNGCNLYLIAATGILSVAYLRGKRNLNCHHGVIPAARGLNVFRRIIYVLLLVSVTPHYIDEQINAREIVFIVPTLIFPSDSLEVLTRHHYENENQDVSQFDLHLKQLYKPLRSIVQEESMRCMKAELPEWFAQYEHQALSLAQNANGTQIPPSNGHFHLSPFAPPPWKEAA